MILRNIILLKFGLIKGYEFTDDFINKHVDLVNELDELYDNDIYGNACCVFAAGQQHRDNVALKKRICMLLKKFFDLNIRIENNFTDEQYKSYPEIEDYILNYAHND